MNNHVTKGFGKRFPGFLLWLVPVFLMGFAVQVQAQYTGSGAFTQLNGLAELEDGYYVVTNAPGEFAMNSAHTGVFLPETPVNPVDGILQNPNVADVWLIEADGSSWTIFSEATQQFVSYTGPGNNVQVVDEVTSDNDRWNFDFADGEFVLTNAEITERTLRYNPSSPRFATYASGFGQNLSLFRLGDDNGTEPSPIDPFALLTPPNNTNLPVFEGGTDDVVIEWEAAEGADTYTWLAVAQGGSFDEPLLAIPADNGGAATSLTLTTGAIYDVLAGLGIEEGSVANLTWTVEATAGDDSRLAIQQWAINIVAPVVLADIEALRAADTGSTVYAVANEATFLGGDGFRNTKFFQDASGFGIQIDDAPGIITSTYEIGDNVNLLHGTLGAFQGQLRLTPFVDYGAAVSSGNAIDPLERTLDELSFDDQARLIVVRNVAFENAGQNFGGGGSITSITDPSLDDFTGRHRNVFGGSDITGSPIPEGEWDIVAVVQENNAGLNIAARSLADFSPADDDQAIAAFNLLSPADGTSLVTSPDNETEVIITWEEAEGADTYTWLAVLDGGDFSDPLLALPADDEGAATTLTVTVAALDGILEGLGVAEGESVNLQWTVNAEAGDDSRLANMPFGITLERDSEQPAPAAFSLLSPPDNTRLPVFEGSDDAVVIEWEASENATSYTWLAVPDGGDFSDPLLALAADEEGTAKTLTLTSGAIYDVLTSLGIEEGTIANLEWTVEAANGGLTRLADQQWNISLVAPVVVADIESLRGAETGSTMYAVANEATFLGGDGFRNTKFFQDASGFGIQIDDQPGIISSTYEIGDNVNMLHGTLGIFQGQLRLSPFVDFGAAVSSGNEIEPLERTLDELSFDDQARLIVVRSVSFQNAGQNFGGGGSITSITDPSLDGFNGRHRNVFGGSDITGSPIPEGEWDIVAVVQENNAGLNIAARSLADFSPAEAAIAAFDLLAPADGTSLVTSPDDDTEVVIEWETAEGAETYTWLAVTAGGDFSDPPLAIPADDEGAATTLTVPVSALDGILADLGIEEGGIANLQWTVRAEAGDETRLANSPFAITLERASELPVPAAFDLLSPPNNARIAVFEANDTEVVVEWEASENAQTYTWLATLPEGDFDEPLLAIPADADGAATTLTLTSGAVYAALTGLGIDPGTTATIQWTVRAENDDLTRLANQAWTLVIDVPLEVTLNEARVLPANTVVSTSGLVTTPDFGFNAAEFYFQDEDGGMKVRWPGFGGGNTDTPFAAGQEVQIVGFMTERFQEIVIQPTAFEILSEDNTLPEANPIIDYDTQWVFDSADQGRRVTILEVSLVDPDQWPTEPISAGSGVTVEAIDADGNIYDIRIDRDESEFEASPVPPAVFNLSGVLGRFNENAQIFPFFAFELEEVAESPRVQLIHNAADPALANVDVYVDGGLLFGDVPFRGATPFFEAPASFTVSLTAAGAPIEDAVFEAEVELDGGESYYIIAQGVLDPEAFDSNPNGISTAFTLDIIEGAVEGASVPNAFDFIIYHGVTDAPAVDVVARDLAALAENLSYTDVSEFFIQVPADVYTLDVNPAGTPDPVFSFDADLSAFAGRSGVVLASGFLDASQGESFGLLAVLDTGEVAFLNPSTSLGPIDGVPVAFELSQNYPNPFNPTTQIQYALPEATDVRVEVFNISGQRVAVLVNGQQAAGVHNVTFDGSRLSSGVYLYRIQAGSFQQVRKMMLVK
ncbi:Por secretion system C-terminal sorting domain-containing protein [Cyclonatronum proteinivorum]|uniref:Por secretion system C-terminal sorting domain-containing protein n=1 Tax=Cyclonatronum proteinivorum TaxID=1457365 RepID=A0A345UJ36_9BACT|nr:SusE domain-containing protein [Cyclonatronum proteinivorum]AXJ00488.1 Por secretion system C-terminal sorting domain-containing protein [Cyclonatronum proteinivorum]